MKDVNPPKAREVAEAGVDHSVHVATQGDPEVTRVDNYITDIQGVLVCWNCYGRYWRQLLTPA